jgi:hypothetical protein
VGLTLGGLAVDVPDEDLAFFDLVVGLLDVLVVEVRFGIDLKN